MKQNLIQSFKDHLDRIRVRQSVVVETHNGFYHSYDKSLIKHRIMAIHAEILRLTYSPETHAIMAMRNESECNKPTNQ